MFKPKDILYEDNHLLVVNKQAGDLVQADKGDDVALEQMIKEWIKKRDKKPGNVFLEAVHRIDRPVSGAVMFAKTSKALARLNEMMKMRSIGKKYLVIVEASPRQDEETLRHWILRDGKTNRSRAYDSAKPDAKEALLNYRLLGASSNYYLLEVDLLTGRHHQIRAQLSKIGCPVRGDLKYGAKRSLPDGGISLHSSRIEFIHPVSKEEIKIKAPVPSGDNLWKFFAESSLT